MVQIPQINILLITHIYSNVALRLMSLTIYIVIQIQWKFRFAVTPFNATRSLQSYAQQSYHAMRHIL